MALSRRQFIKAIPLAGIGVSYGLNAAYTDMQDSLHANQSTNSLPEIINRIQPPALKKGDYIAITAPASPTNPWEIKSAINAFEREGFKVLIGDTVKNNETKQRYFSASDTDRAEEFMKFVTNKDVKLILCGRGGYGSMRILPFIDYAELVNNPKIIMGFSDITAIINAVFVLSGLVSIHGPVAISTFDSGMINMIGRFLKEGKEFTPYVVKDSEVKAINHGFASGKLIGGNLSIITSTLGTPYEIDTKDFILFFEEVSEHPYKIDRMLTQLQLAGKFDNCKGVAIGYMKGLNNKRHFFPNGSFTLKETFERFFAPLDIPTIIGLPIGHIKNQLLMPIGIEAEIDTRKLTFTITESPVQKG